MDLRRFLLIVRQHVWLLVALTVASLAAFLLLPQLGARTVYVSTAKVLLTPSKTSIGSESYRGYEQGNWLSEESTLKELVTSERLLSRVCQVCSVRGSWQELRDRVTLEPLSTDYARRVNLFAISVQDESAKQAQKLTEAAVSEFTNYVEELSAREFANTRRFLEELVAEAKERVDDTEEKLLQITTAHADAKQSETMAESLVALDADKRKVREEIAVLEAEVGSVQSFLSRDSAVLPPSLLQTPDPTVTQLETAAAEARLKLLELEQLYNDDNPRVREQRAKYEKMRDMYQSRMSEFANSAIQEKSQLLAQKRKQLQAIEDRIQEVRNQQLSPAEKRQVAKLERQLSMWEDNHLNLVKQLYQARVVEQSSRRQGAISVLESPGLGALAKAKKSRSLTSRLAIGLPFCLSFSLACILSLELLGASLRLLPKIERALGVPVLSVIPPLGEDMAEVWECYKREETLPKQYESLLDDSELNQGIPKSEIARPELPARNGTPVTVEGSHAEV